MGKKRRKLTYCTNCNQKLREDMNFCHYCGQENHIKRVSLKLLFTDFLSTYLTFESKFFITLKKLVTQPAYLTKSYLSGKIMSYLPPIRLYLFVSFLFFILLNLSLNNPFREQKDSIIDTIAIKISEEFKDVNVNTDKKEAELAEEKENRSGMYVTTTDADVEKNLKKIFSDASEIKVFFRLLKEKIPILLFLTIPILAFLFFVFFYKKERYYVDCFVFVLHMQSFLFLTFIVAEIIEIVTTLSFQILSVLVFVVYLFIASKRFFEKKGWSTFFRLLIISVFHFLLSLFLFVLYFVLMIKFY